MNLFEKFSVDYDKMVNWSKRLEREETFFRKLFEDTGAKRVLDLGCGTGNHAIMFARWGLEVTGMDPSEAMVEKAMKNAQAAGVRAEFRAAGFLDFASKVQGTFEVVVILGNSLPHLLKMEELHRCLDDIYRVLGAKGALVIQNRNYDKVMAHKERFMPLNAWEHEGEEVLFLRFLDFAEGLVNFNIVTMTKKNGKWDYQVLTNPLRPILAAELDQLLASGGWQDRQYFGDFNSTPFSPAGSTDLIVVAGKKEA